MAAITEEYSKSLGLNVVENNGDGTGSLKVKADSITAGETHIGEVGGRIVEISQSFTRESNATPYGIGDVVSAAAATVVPAIALTNIARVNGGSGYIMGCRLITNDKSKVPAFRVHLYNVNTAVIAGDNLNHKELYADNAKKVAQFDLPAMTTPQDSTNSDISRTQDFTLRIPFVCAGGSRTLYVVLETLTAFTPASGSQFTIVVTANLN